jgi:hypothetical protein
MRPRQARKLRKNWHAKKKPREPPPLPRRPPPLPRRPPLLLPRRPPPPAQRNLLALLLRSLDAKRKRLPPTRKRASLDQSAQKPCRSILHCARLHCTRSLSRLDRTTFSRSFFIAKIARRKTMTNLFATLARIIWHVQRAFKRTLPDAPGVDDDSHQDEWIACKNHLCGRWYHAKCIDIKQQNGSFEDVFQCPFCICCFRPDCAADPSKALGKSCLRCTNSKCAR